MFRLPISSRALLFATLISALHSLLPPSATFASGPQGDRPQISIKKNYVAISVTVGAELKPLAEVFADCLSEGKAWANLVSRSAAAEWRDNRKAFRDELKWFYDRDYELRSVVGRYVSVVRSDDWFDGGAHPNRTSTRFCGTASHREELRLDVSLFALRSRSLRRGNLHGLCSVASVSAIFVAAGRGALWRRAVKKR